MIDILTDGYRGLVLGEPKAKSYEKAKLNLKKAVLEIKEHKKKNYEKSKANKARGLKCTN